MDGCEEFPSADPGISIEARWHNMRPTQLKDLHYPVTQVTRHLPGTSSTLRARHVVSCNSTMFYDLK